MGSEYILKSQLRGFPDRVVLWSERKREIRDVSGLSHWKVELPSTELGDSAVEGREVRGTEVRSLVWDTLVCFQSPNGDTE